MNTDRVRIATGVGVSFGFAGILYMTVMARQASLFEVVAFGVLIALGAIGAMLLPR